MENARVSSSNSSSFFQDCSKDQRPGEVNYEIRLPDLGEKPNQPTSFNHRSMIQLPKTTLWH